MLLLFAIQQLLFEEDQHCTRKINIAHRIYCQEDKALTI